ncbi:MAG: ABC transporter permease subunit [Acidobacteriota bacterium]
MEKNRIFTGRAHRRSTSHRVHLADLAARFMITVGGTGTLVAVLGVFVFLVWVVLPLFLPVRADEAAAFTAPARLEGALHAGMDEYQVLGWALLPDGEVVSYRLDSGEVRGRARPFGDQAPTAWSFPAGTEQAAFGFADGTVELATFTFRTTFLSGTDLTPRQRQALGGEGAASVVNLRRGVAGMTPEGQVRLQELQVTAGERVRAAAGPVRLVALAERADGPFLAVLAEGENGPALAAITGSEEEDFLTGGTRLLLDDPVSLPMPPGPGGWPRFLAVDGSGANVYLAWEDGTLARVHCAPLNEPFIAETGRLTLPGTRVTAMDFILGHGTLVWGDTAGHLHGGFLVPVEQARGMELREVRREPGRTLKTLAVTKDLGHSRVPVTTLAPSGRSRVVAAGFADGTIRLFHVTTQATLASLPADAGGAGIGVLAIAPKEDGLLAEGGAAVRHWSLDLRYPEASFAALFRPVWYEGYPAPRHVWQSSSGTDDFEPKLGLMPLIFGTLKATVYSILFGAPLALLAAIFTSEFLDRRTRALVKPGVEMMASLPSVVLGFLAALVFAPVVEKTLPAVLAAFLTVPLVFLIGAYLWQMLPVAAGIRLARRRFLFQMLAIPPGLFLAVRLGPYLERFLFAGDFKAWLAWVPGKAAGGGASPYASPLGGWVFLALPPCILAAALLISRLAAPRLRAVGADWPRRRLAQAELAKFIGGAVLSLALAVALAWLLAAAGLDPRGNLLDTYVQRNALVVGFVMGFAIIPIIYTIAEDALSSVPEHLRSASLGAGATPWQTAARIVIPSAMSGLFSALMIGLGRAAGETMIVLMAAGNTPVMSWNIFEGFRTLSANIAVELPEAVRNSTHYRTLFLAALVLFAMTFLVNTAAEMVRLRFRRRARQL